jgi:Mrp family chromosome partitioning ATPase/capsular polysaccharide biosynthesis protein
MNDTTPDATSIFAPVWRRKWLILAVAVLVAAASYLYYKRERPTFQVGTTVFLGVSAEEQLPTSKSSKNKGSSLSGVSTIIGQIVVEEVRKKLRAEHRGKEVGKAKVRAKVPEKSEFIDITVEGHTRNGSALLANLVAQTYIKRQETKRQRSIRKAITLTRRQILRLEAAAAAKEAAPAKNSKAPTKSKSAPSTSNVLQVANLDTKVNELEAMAGNVTAVQLKPAKPSNATLLSPKPRKDAEFGFVIALVLASLAAIVASRFDRRLRTLAAMEAAFGRPLLTVLPKVGRPVVREAGASRPSNMLLEPLRRLDTELLLAESLDGDVTLRRKVILVVSPDPGDGKSTLVADLALVQRDAGRHVAVLEANFRRPVLSRLLSLDGVSPLPEVLSGRVELDAAMQRVLPAHAPEMLADEPGGGVATATQAGVGSLFALTADRSVANPPALLSQPYTAEVVRTLGARFDKVLIDVPSPLEVSDAVPLFPLVDGILVVARSGHTRDASARRLQQMLAAHGTAPVIGVVANFVGRRELRRYGFATGGSSGLFGGGRGGR